MIELASGQVRPLIISGSAGFPNGFTDAPLPTRPTLPDRRRQAPVPDPPCARPGTHPPPAAAPPPGAAQARSLKPPSHPARLFPTTAARQLFCPIGPARTLRNPTPRRARGAPSAYVSRLLGELQLRQVGQLDAGR